MRTRVLFRVAAVGLSLILTTLFADFMSSALLKLRLNPRTAALLVVGIFAGSLINIPVKRMVRPRPVETQPYTRWGASRFGLDEPRGAGDTILALNIGGCLIPVALAMYEALSLATDGRAFAALAIAVALNVMACHRLASPVAGVGIVVPMLVPPALAAISALVLSPAHATPVAFVAGVLGPLVGADLLHLHEVSGIQAGTVSIGGAGTFDGILLSGIVALYLA